MTKDLYNHRVSISGLNLLARSPRAYKKYIESPRDEDSEALIKAYNILIGSADPAAIKHHYDYGLDAEDAEDIVENAKRQFRKDYPVIEMKLYKWGFLKSFSSPINDSVEEALQALRTKHNDIIKQPYLVETMYQGPARDQ